ncbi:MAG: HAD family phosphatase, partial [Vicinamibacteraceae bacterium]
MTSPFPARRVAGVVFDIDGTLLDNMPFHIEAFEAFTAAHGLPGLTLEMRKWMDGRRNSDIFPRLFERALTEAEIASLSHEKESAYRRLSAGRLEPLSGLIRLLDALDAAGVPIAAATSAPRDNVVHTLRELGLDERLAVIARSDEVAHGKPEPDVFIEA